VKKFDERLGDKDKDSLSNEERTLENK